MYHLLAVLLTFPPLGAKLFCMHLIAFACLLLLLLLFARALPHISHPKSDGGGGGGGDGGGGRTQMEWNESLSST